MRKISMCNVFRRKKSKSQLKKSYKYQKKKRMQKIIKVNSFNQNFCLVHKILFALRYFNILNYQKKIHINHINLMGHFLNNQLQIYSQNKNIEKEKKVCKQNNGQIYGPNISLNDKMPAFSENNQHQQKYKQKEIYQRQQQYQNQQQQEFFVKVEQNKDNEQTNLNQRNISGISSSKSELTQFINQINKKVKQMVPTSEIPATLKKLLKPKAYQKLEKCFVDQQQLSLNVQIQIKNQPNQPDDYQIKLDLSQTQFDRNMFKYYLWTKLVQLNLSNCLIKNEDIELFQSLKLKFYYLKVLDLSQNPFTEINYEKFEKFETLKRIRVKNKWMTRNTNEEKFKEEQIDQMKAIQSQSKINSQWEQSIIQKSKHSTSEKKDKAIKQKQKQKKNKKKEFLKSDQGSQSEQDDTSKQKETQNKNPRQNTVVHYFLLPQSSQVTRNIQNERKLNQQFLTKEFKIQSQEDRNKFLNWIPQNTDFSKKFHVTARGSKQLIQNLKRQITLRLNEIVRKRNNTKKIKIRLGSQTNKKKKKVQKPHEPALDLSIINEELNQSSVIIDTANDQCTQNLIVKKNKSTEIIDLTDQQSLQNNNQVNNEHMMQYSATTQKKEKQQSKS